MFSVLAPQKCSPVAEVREESSTVCMWSLGMRNEMGFLVQVMISICPQLTSLCNSTLSVLTLWFLMHF